MKDNDDKITNVETTQTSTESTSVNKKIGAIMVVGAGIGGMQAALTLADSGFKVYLVEKTPSVGGIMAGLDKTFPTNECAMCTITPTLVGAGRHTLTL